MVLAKQMMVFPFTVPLDGSGRMLDAAQGVYARSLARMLAERLSEPPGLSASLAQLTADGPLTGGNRTPGHGWVVASSPWTLEEACHIGLPEGTEYLLHGSAELTDRVRLRILLVDSPQKHLALDHVVLRPREELFPALDEAAAEIARALGEDPPGTSWPTGDVEAYVAYLRGRDMSAAHEMGVRVPDPNRSFDPYLEAARRDPRFSDAQERLLSLALDFALGGRGPAAAAREACEKLLAIDETAFKAHLALAEMDLLQGDAPAAEGRIARALSLQPGFAAAFERMGTALSHQGRWREAVPWFEKAVAARSDDAEALRGLGTALLECGRLEKAVECWRGALALGVETADLHDRLARTLDTLGQRQQARAHRALSRRLQGKPRFGLDLLREAWEWLSGGTRRGS
ncbi:MAG TPA: tetratricopeptide repeat protein [Myxococcales bacterium]|nr:tetratricopeptide repeat protein [Myxococcales bacterium]